MYVRLNRQRYLLEQDEKLALGYQTFHNLCS